MQSRTRLIAGNWKMNKTYAEAVKLAQELSYSSDRWTDQVEVLVCPPHTSLKGVQSVFSFDHVRIALGAQNVSAHQDGAYTGEISVRMLEELGCSYCIIGHSERRQLLGESNQAVGEKLAALWNSSICPIMCVGEPREVYEAGTTLTYVVDQLNQALEVALSLVEEKGDTYGSYPLVLAYEPIWAIGSGQVATPEHAQQVCAALRDQVRARLGEKAADQTRVLYGGSVKAPNASQFLDQEDIDGALVGTASLTASDFSDIVEAAHA